MTNNSNFLQACPALAAWSTNCRSNAWCSGKVLPQRVLALWNVCVCVRACVRVCACALRYYEVNMQQCRVGMSITELCFGCRSVNKDLLQQNTKIQENTHTHTHTHTHKMHTRYFHWHLTGSFKNIIWSYLTDPQSIHFVRPGFKCVTPCS